MSFKVLKTPRAQNAAPTHRLRTLKPTFLHQHRFGSPEAAKAASVLRTNAFLVGHRNGQIRCQTSRAPNVAPAQRLLALKPTFLHQHKFGSPGAAKAASVLRTETSLVGYRNVRKRAENTPSTKCCASTAFASPETNIPALAQVW